MTPCQSCPRYDGCSRPQAVALGGIGCDDGFALLADDLTRLRSQLAAAESRLARLPAYEAECAASYKELQAVCRAETERASAAESRAAEAVGVLGFIDRTVESCPCCHGKRSMVKHAEDPTGWRATTRTGPIEHRKGCALAACLRGVER